MIVTVSEQLFRQVLKSNFKSTVTVYVPEAPAVTVTEVRPYPLVGLLVITPLPLILHA